VVQTHYSGEEWKAHRFGAAHRISFPSVSECKKDQVVISVAGEAENCHKFLFNWCALDDDFTLFWVAYIGQKDLSTNYKYTLKVESKEDAKKYLFEGTRMCLPCDLSHTDVRKKKWTLVLDKDLIAEATREDGRVVYNVTIYKS